MSIRQRIALHYILGILGVLMQVIVTELNLQWYWGWPARMGCWILILQFIEVGRLQERRDTDQAMEIKLRRMVR